MDLAWSAVTMSAHLAIILSILIALGNAVYLSAREHTIRVTPLLRFALTGVASALVVERCYYVIARLLVNSPVDLWSMHPAPEILSGMVASACLFCATAILSTGRDAEHRRLIAAIEIVFVILCGVSLAWLAW
ncbi:hypothetical protein SAMN05421853_10293 [Roseivivax halotolerans]|uniref:Uncharacterized protein n=1 Tax=Roseivivax halotolerans TaxID=93684 RepID=A0A1I5W2V2_9RHOB|nr:hypothetical protein [Roseivivax halotolerans]SFQ14055.1 hypothetical protein SAMN05421853_10293 [Roseivivax halotolerans]